MKNRAREWARRGLAILLSLSMAGGGVPASAYAEALMPEVDEQVATVEESPSMPAFSGEVTVDGVVVSVTAPEGAFPAGVHLEASKVSADEQEAAVAAAADALPEGQNVQSSYVLDVRVVDEAGNEVEPAPGADVQVSFKAAQVADEMTDASVFHVQDNGEIEQLDATVSGDVVAAATDSFSTYVITFSASSGTYTVNWNNMPAKVSVDNIVAAVRTGANELFDSVVSVQDGLVFSDQSDDYNGNIEIPSWFSGPREVVIRTQYNDNGTLRYNTYSVNVTLQDTTKDLSTATVEVAAGTYVYDGTEKKPAVTLVEVDGTEVPAVAYTVSYANNVSAGNAAQAIVTATADGGYKGSASTNFTIQQKEVSVSGITAADKAYDGTTDATVNASAATITGLVADDEGKVTVSATGAFADAEAGSGKTVNLNVTLGGPSAGNYKLSASSQKTTTASITEVPQAIDLSTATITLNTTTQTYDGTEKKPAVTLVEVDGTEVPAVAYTVSYANNVSAGNAAQAIVTATADGGYKGSASTNFTIEQRELTISSGLTVPAKVYDGTTEVKSYTNTSELSGLVEADRAKVGYTITSISYDDANMGSRTVNTTVELTGSLKDNYKLTNTLTANSSITPANVTVKADDAVMIAGGVAPTYTATVSGLVNGEPESTIKYQVTCSHENAAGTYDIIATGNTTQGNYTVTFEKGTLTITSDLARATITVDDQVYTGQQITPTNIRVSIGGDNLLKDTDYEITEYGQNLQVGPGTVTIVGKGTYAGSSKVGTFNITPKSVKVQNITAQSKVYDGTDEATLDVSGASFQGIVDGDTLTVTATGKFQDASVGTDKQVNLSGLTLGGASAANYTLSTDSQTSATANITAASIAGATVTADDQTYTGSGLTPTPTVTLDGKTLVAGTDYETTVTYANNTTVGTATVTVTGKGNYDGTATGRFAINKAKLVVTDIKADNKEYDGTTTATLDFSEAKVQVEGGSEVTGYTITAEGTFKDAKVENGKTVTISNIALAGGDLANYELGSTTATTTANITKKAITFSGITAEDKVKDGTTNATLDTSNMVLTGVIPGEEVTFAVTGEFENANVGSNKVVNITAGELTGTNAANYQLATTGSQKTARASILAAELPVVHVTGIKAVNKAYNGNAIAELDLSNAKVLKADDTEVTGVTVESANGTFVNETGNADANAGENKTVAISSIKLSSTDYILDLEASETTTKASITRVALTVTAQNVSKVYGEQDPTLQVTVSGGLVEGDTIAYDKYRIAGENVGTYDIVVEGQATQGNYTVAYAGATFTINKRAVKVTGITAQDKRYDGNAIAALNYDDVALDGIVANDALGVTATGTFASADAEDGKTVNISNITLTGSAKDNYALALNGNQESATASITKAPITVSGITAEGKVYDGNTEAALVTDAAVFDGIVTGDTLTVSATGTFDTKNVGESKLVSISGLTLGGTSVGNYVLAASGQQSSTIATITPKSVTVTGLEAENKTYDGTTTATINVTNAAFADGDIVAGDEVTVIDAKGTFGGSAPGPNQSVTLTQGTITLGGKDAANYIPNAESYAPNPPLSATIEQAASTLTIDSKTKVYGEADPEFTASFSDASLLDKINYTLEVKGDHADAGTYKITVKDVEGGEVQEVSGVQRIVKDGYVVTVTAGTLTVNSKDVTVTPIANSKTYGQSDPELTAKVDGLVDTDTITYNVTRADGDEVGTYVMTASGDEYQGGTNKKNYHVTYANDPAVYFTIGANVIKVSGITAKDKVYDKTDAAELDLSGIELEGKKDGDDVKVTVSGEFIDANAGMGKLVYLYGYELTGNDAANYVIDYSESQESTTANITRKEVTVKAKDASKTYGQADPAFEIEEIEGLIYGDAIHYELTRQAGEDVGTYTIYPAGEELQPNYKVTYETATFTIGQRRLRVKAGLKAETKVYDGTTDATLDGSAAEFDNLVEGDEVIVTGTGTFDNKNVGKDKAVTIDTIVLGGAKAGNYKLVEDNQTETTGNIIALGVTVEGLTGNDKTYDGNTDATLNVSGATIATAIDDDELSVASATGEFADKNAGEGKDITITNIVLGGADAGNYVVNDDSQSTAKATINPKTVAVSGFTADSKTYDGTKTASVKFDAATIDGIIDPDEVTIESVAADFENADQGTGKEVTITGVTLGGADAGNYTPDWGDPHLTADINRKEVTVVAKDATKVYGDQDPTFDYIAEGLIGTDTIAVSGYERETGEDVKADGYVITPKADAQQGNYQVVINPDGKTPGKLTITTKEASVTPKDSGKVYDNDPTNPAEYEAIVDGTVNDDTLTYTITRDPDSQEIGVYTLTASGDEYQGGVEGKNYHVTYGTGTYSIDEISSIADAVIEIPDETYTGKQIKPEDFTVKLGDKELQKDVDYEIVYYGDNVNAGNAAGDVYIMGLGGYTGGATGYFNIKPIDIVVTPSDATKVYGENDPNFEYTVADAEGTPVQIVDGNNITVVVTRQQGEDVGEYAINATGGNNQGNYNVTFKAGTFTITQRRLRVKSGITAKDKVYDATDAAELDTTGAVFQNLVAGDDVSVTATGKFENKNVGENKKVSISDIALTGSKARNYKLVDGNQEETEATITAAKLSVKADTITAAEKVYDGTTDATIDVSTAEFEGVFEGDEVSVDSADAAFADKHAAKDKTVTISNITLAGTDADNYVLDPETTTTKATITPKPVTVSGITAETKDYDGSKEATLVVDEATISGLITADEGKVIVASATGKFKSETPGTDKIVNIDIDSIVLGPAEGADEDVSGDYVATPDPAMIEGNINFLEVTVTVEAKEKTYGEDDPELIAKVEPSKYADDIEYELKRVEGNNVGEYEIQFVNPQAQQKQKYNVTYVTDKLTIKPKAITVTVKDNGKVYGQDDPSPLTTIECDELVDGDTVDDLAVEFAREEGEKLGEYQITATEPAQIPDGKKNANYTITFVPGTFTIHEIGDIAPAVIEIEDVTYNGKQQKPEDFKVTLDGNELTKGVDYEIVSYGPNKDAGDDAGTVTIKGIGGYVGEATGTFTINPLEITVTPDDASKSYGEVDPALTYKLSQDLINGDSLVVTLHREQGEDARTYAINASGGETQGNYLVTFETGTFTINKRQVTVDGIKAADKVYDGNADAELVFDDAQIHDLAYTDTLTVTATGTFASKNVFRKNGEVANKRVDITNIKLVGEKAANYEVVADQSQKTASAKITPAPVKVGGITADDKTYDGNTEATLVLTDATFEGIVEGDELSVESASGSFVDKNADKDKVVNVSDIVLAGADAGNYYVNPEEGVQATTTATITPKEVIVDNIGTEDKDYDKTNVATLVVTDATIDGLVADDEGKVIVKAATGHFSDANAGKGKSVVIDTVTFGPAEGADEDVSGNYVAKLPESHAQEAEIRALKITVIADDKTKVYGEDDPVLTYNIDPGIPEGETLDINIKREVGQDAGEYAISFDNPQKWLAGGNYEVEYVDGTLEITSRPVTVTPVDNSKIYGEDDPELTAEVTSELDPALVGEDELVYTVKRVEGQDAGTYDITVEGEELQGGASNKNYKVTYAGPATFTIKPKEVTVTAASFTKKYGEADPEFTASVDPEMPNGETIQYKLDRVKGEDGGQSYAIFFVDNPEYQSGKSDSDAPNYHITYVNGKLTIDRLQVKVKADDKAKTYGSADPELTATVTGTTKGETVTYKLERVAGEEPGTYDINVTGEAIQGSYEVTYEKGTFAIGEQLVTVTADDFTKVYGEADPTFTAVVEGVNGTDTITYTFVREEGEDVGEYAITPTGEASQLDGKYAVVFVPGTLTITPKVVTVDGITTDPEGRVYDGTTNVELVTDDAQVHDLAFEDELTVVATGHFVDKHAGDDKDVLIDSIELTGEKAKNYQLDVAKSQKMTTGKVNRKPVTIKPAVNITKVYGESDPEEIRIAKDVTVEGLLNGDNLVYLPTALTREAGEQVGEYDVKFFVQPYQGDYVVTCEPGTLTITPRPIKITNIAAKDKVYDSTVAAELDLSKIKVENLVTDVPFRDRLEEGRLEVSATAEFESKDAADGKTVNITGITLTGDIAHNYVVDGESQATATASIFKAPVKVDGIKADDKVYDATTDATLDVSEATFETLFDGDEVTVESATGTFDTKNVVVDEEGNCVAKTVYVSEIKLAGTDGGNYYVLETEDEEDPDGTQAIASATITPFQVIVKDVEVAEATKPDGTTGRGKVYDKTTDVDLDWSNATIHTLYDIDEGKVDVAKVEGYYNDPDAGTGKMVTLKTVTLSGEEAINYTAVPDPEPHTFGDIWRKPVTVTANDASKTYGETDPELSATLDPAPFEGDTIDYTIIREPGEDAGEYVIKFDNPQNQQGNYQVTFVNGTFTINSRPITVTADDLSKVYGEADPELTATITSEFDPALVGDDTVDYTVEREPGEDYGTYVTSFKDPVELQGGANNKNYKITYVDGEFVIDTRVITITVDDKSKLYGEADPKFTVTYTLDSENATGEPVVAGDKIEYSIPYARDRYEADGDIKYTIPIEGAVNQAGHAFADGHKEGHDHNYTINYKTGTLTVERRHVTVTADNMTITYGAADPVFTATVTGTTKGETVTYKLTRQPGKNVGTYVITPTGEPVQGNYIVTYKTGTLTIKPKAVTVTPNSLSKVYGSKDPKFTAKVVGLVGKDSVNYTISRAKGENVGKYAITATGKASQGNYKVTFKAGTFTITPKTVKVAAKSLSKMYGEKDPTLTASVTGLIGKDTVKYKLIRQTGEDAGTYAIRASGTTTQGNYKLVFTNGTFTIKRRAVTVTPVNASKYYGKKDPTLKAKVTGATKGETVTYKLTRAKGEKVGTYKITASGKKLQGNYTVTYKTGTFKIADVEKLIPEYSAHVMSFGWSPATYDGDFAGTTGQKRRMEAVTLKVTDAPYSGGITYRANVQTKGWTSWVKDGALAGTWGKKLQSEAFQIKLYGELAKHYDVYYRVHTMTLGWMAWAKNGQTSGTIGENRRCEAIQVIILRKGSKAPSANYKGVAQMYNKASR